MKCINEIYTSTMRFNLIQKATITCCVCLIVNKMWRKYHDDMKTLVVNDNNNAVSSQFQCIMHRRNRNLYFLPWQWLMQSRKARSTGATLKRWILLLLRYSNKARSKSQFAIFSFFLDYVKLFCTFFTQNLWHCKIICNTFKHAPFLSTLQHVLLLSS